MDLDRREFARVLGGSALAMASGTRSDAASRVAMAGKTTFNVLMRGGYVYIMTPVGNQKHSIQFGPVARPPLKAPKEEFSVYERHDLLLAVVKGEPETALKPAVQGLKVWNLNGMTVSFAPGGQPMTGGVKLPPATTNGKANWNDLKNLPNMLDLARGLRRSNPKMSANPGALLNGSVTLNGGDEAELTILAPEAEPKLKYKKPKAMQVKLDAYASDTMMYTAKPTLTEAADYIEIKLEPRGDDNRERGAIRVKPENSQVHLVISPLMHLGHDHHQGVPIEHFAMFYRLLEVVPAVKDRPVPHPYGVERTPGIFCPPGVYIR